MQHIFKALLPPEDVTKMTKTIFRIISVCSWRAGRMKSFMSFVTSHFWSRMRFFIINMIVIVTIVNTIIVINIIIIITIVTTINYHQATTSKGAQPLAPADFQPVVKKSVCYIVAAVLFNEKNEVMMMTMTLLNQEKILFINAW